MELVLEKVMAGPSLAKGEVQASTPTKNTTPSPNNGSKYSGEIGYNQKDGAYGKGTSFC